MVIKWIVIEWKMTILTLVEPTSKAKTKFKPSFIHTNIFMKSCVLILFHESLYALLCVCWLLSCISGLFFALTLSVKYFISHGCKKWCHSAFKHWKSACSWCSWVAWWFFKLFVHPYRKFNNLSHTEKVVKKNTIYIRLFSRFNTLNDKNFKVKFGWFFL